MDNLPFSIPDFIALVSVAVGVLLLILIIILRSRSVTAAEVILEDESSFDDPSIEYEWVASPRVWSKAIGVLVAIAIFTISVITIDELQDLFRSIYQIGIVILGLFSSIFANAFKKFRYRITSVGVYRNEVGKKGDPKLLFTWQRLSWFSPKTHGFKYYLKPGGEGTVNLSRSGFVEAGDRGTLVNAIVMSRSIPTSPPDKEDSYKEPSRSFERT